MSFADEHSASSGDDHKLYVDHANVEYNAGKHVNFLVGRYDYQIGNGMGIQYGDTFDGAQLKFSGDHWALTGGYGKFKEADPEAPNPSLLDVKTGYASLDGARGVTSVPAFITITSAVIKPTQPTWITSLAAICRLTSLRSGTSWAITNA